MKLGRLILTHREDLIPTLKEFYLGPRTDFLVIAYDPTKVIPEKFQNADNFKLVPYAGVKGHIAGQQYRVWYHVAKKFPEIQGWVIHDYDFFCRPSDAEIFTHIKPGQYGMIGKAFPVWQEGMGETDLDTYPFPQSHRYWNRNDLGLTPAAEQMRKILMDAYPAEMNGVSTYMGGYGDFIAAYAEEVCALDDPKIDEIHDAGVEQVEHTVWRAKGITPVDMRNFYKLKVLLDVVYIPRDDAYDMMHPVKFWDKKVGGPDWGARRKNFLFKMKKFVKGFIGHEGWRK